MGFVGSSVDIDDRRRAEADREDLLRAARRGTSEAEAALRARDVFLAKVSHELRTPLNSIAGWAQLLRMQPDAETLAKGVDVIGRSVQTLDRLIQDLLDVSRIASGRLQLDLQAVDLGDVVAAAVEGVRAAAEAKGVVLERSLGERRVVAGDPARLQRIAASFLTNAVRHTPRGARVAITVEQVAGEIVLAVRDDGEGMGEETLAHLFDGFQPLPDGGKRPSGLGLGLTLAHRLAALHGGRLEAYSAGPGRGSTLRLLMPPLSAHARIGDTTAIEAPRRAAVD